MNWYLQVLQKYAVFSGRARRKEYWYFTLFNFLIGMSLALLDSVTGLFDPEIGVGLFGGIYTLVIFLPSFAVLFRRLHDTGRSGWWWLIIFIPVLGAITLLVFVLFDSDPNENEYGPNPKNATETNLAA